MNIKSLLLSAFLISLGALAAFPATPELGGSAIAVVGLLAIFGGEYSRKARPLGLSHQPATILRMEDHTETTLPLAA